jgi:hypothetical protein
MTCHYSCKCPLVCMTPYDHLKHFFILCINHFQRGIHKLGMSISNEVRTAMHSLISAHSITSLETTLDLIRQGGPKAAGELPASCR